MTILTNTLYVGVRQASISRFQSVQNAAAHLQTSTQSASPLYWPPSIDFLYILGFIYIFLNGLAHTFLSDLLEPYLPSRSLGSSDQLLLAVRKSRAFAVVAPKLWTKLPLHVRQLCRCSNHA